jgi:hypothetical protein
VAAASTARPLGPAGTRRSREVLVTLPQGTRAGTKSAADVAKEIKGASGGISGARKLPSGAFALTFQSEEAKEAWKGKGGIQTVFGSQASLRESTTDVIVFGFPKGAISNLQPTERLKAIQDSNPMLASLSRVGVLKGPQIKRNESVILGFSGAKAANQAIELGVIWEDSLLSAEPYNSEIRSTRCYNCLSYSNHSARYYRASPGVDGVAKQAIR